MEMGPDQVSGDKLRGRNLFGTVIVGRLGPGVSPQKLVGVIMRGVVVKSRREANLKGLLAFVDVHVLAHGTGAQLFPLTKALP
ncbi:hypothetical protein GJ744_007686 [Endocarpon pusillum]|uniref:Uncharacterized protein n=1 Tax=Endocarpon pusillum TaxID=364733 RepID=A0A8H7AIG0_9EURO|nr:hypothetical protein GJ744_007686 [Endocarpon pusillum]